jgi:hypothetical protein
MSSVGLTWLKFNREFVNAQGAIVVLLSDARRFGTQNPKANRE